MIRTFTASVLIILFFCSISYSQDVKKTGGFARLAGMGGNPYIIDPFFITVNPAWGAEYDNFLFGDIGGSVGAFQPGGFGQYISANFGIGDNFTLGGILSRNDFNRLSIALLDPYGNFILAGSPQVPTGLGVVGWVNNNITGGSVTPLDNNLEFFGTLSFGRTAVGLGIAYASTSNETPADTGSNKGSANQLGVNVGLLTNLTGSIKLDIGASIVFPSATFEPAEGNNTEASQTLIAVNTRLFWKYSSKLWFVPAVAFATASGTQDIGGQTTTTSTDFPSATIITAGIGINYIVGDFLLAGGPSFASVSVTTPAPVGGTTPELTSSVFAFPVWNLGIEWNLLDWLVGRLGYFTATFQTTLESAIGTDVVETINTAFLPPNRGATVGVGFRFGDFSLDATVNEDVLRQGFNNIGGGSPSFAYLSASYAMP